MLLHAEFILQPTECVMAPVKKAFARRKEEVAIANEFKTKEKSIVIFINCLIF